MKMFEKFFNRLKNNGLNQENSSSVSTTSKINTSKNNLKKISYILLGSIALTNNASNLSFSKEISKPKSQNETFVFADGESVLAETGLDVENINDNVLLETKRTKLLNFKQQMTFAKSFDQTDYVNDEEYAKILQDRFLEIESELIQFVLKRLKNKLRNLNLTLQEQREVIRNALVIQPVIAQESLITGYTCPLNSTLNSKNNIDLGNLRAEIASSDFTFAIKSIPDLLIGDIANQTNNIQLNAQEIRKHGVISKVINSLNDFTLEQTEELFQEFLQKHPAYNNYVKNIDDIQNINYRKFSKYDDDSYIKFNIASQFLKFVNMNQYNDLLIKGMAELRKVQIEVKVDINLILYGAFELNTSSIDAPFEPSSQPNHEPIKAAPLKHYNAQEKIKFKEQNRQYLSNKQIFTKNRPRMKPGGRQGGNY